MLIDELGFTTGDLCASVALILVHDAAENCLGTSGFPQITATRSSAGFTITMTLADAHVSVEVNEIESKNMVKKMKEAVQYDADVFDRVQEAIAQLTALSRRAH
jgi:hypothetical protein